MTDLQQMEARAIAAELVIDKAKSIRDDDDGQTACFEVLKDVMGALYEINTAAARGLIAKAASVDGIREQCDTECKELTTWKNTYWESSRKWQQTAFDLKEQADTLRTRLRESEALVERLSRALANLENDDMSIPDTIWEECLLAKRLTPAAALEQYRAEVLEEVAKHWDAIENKSPMRASGPGDIAAEIRAMKAPEKGGE